jgi:hypothetical protein
MIQRDQSLWDFSHGANPEGKEYADP